MEQHGTVRSSAPAVLLLLLMMAGFTAAGSNCNSSCSIIQQYLQARPAATTQQQEQHCCEQPSSSTISRQHEVAHGGSCAAAAAAAAGAAQGPSATAVGGQTALDKGQAHGSSSRSSSSPAKEQQQCLSSSDCSRENFIVRFSQYKLISEHKETLHKALAHLQQHWSWIERTNKAVQYPSDFAVLSVARPALQQLQQELQRHVANFRDIHPDKQIRGMLNWEPEEPLASAFSNIQPRQQRQQQQQHPALKQHQSNLRLRQEPYFGQQQQQEQLPGTSQLKLARQLLGDDEPSAPAPAPAQQDQQGNQQQPQNSQQQHAQDADVDDADSIWTVSKPPGRLSTKPTIGLDPRNPADREENLPKEELKRRQRSLLGWRELLRSLSSRRLTGAAGAAPGRSLSSDNRVTSMLEAEKLWSQGYSGEGIKVGVFDTGIREGHPHIRNIKERTNWTHQQSLSDGLGHGSFVAGVIGSQDSTCPGFAPDVQLYTFKVFTDDQVSYTSWFLDAFNYAIASKLTVINLSIGGPDFLDAPFVDKVWEVTSNGAIMVSAIGNDGPLYGTLNNPADQPDVIGVGGIDYSNHIASFSSRGMTTWELPTGTGRIKPDVMAYGKDVTGSKMQGGCRSLSGTSVASPVVAGAVCLLASTVPEDKRWMLNPASMKQALVEGAVRLPDLNMHEQGNGRINLPNSQAILANYTPRASLIPPAIHLSDCPYMWPHCKQPLYAFALPVVLNATVVNGMGNTGYFDGQPVYEGTDEGGKMLHVTFKYSEVLWPWSGYLAIYVQVSPTAWNYSGNATGTITFTITSPPQLGSKEPQKSKVVVPLSAAIRPTPPRQQRIIWDVLHSIKYPPGYVPRDNLDIKSDVLDWHGDHPYTNFHDAYDALRNAGFFVEVMSSPGTCFDPANYGAYIVLDSEEEWYKEEVDALAAAVKEHGMALVVFAEWYHEESLKQMKFFDDNTRSWWTPITGGANVPALNDLLKPHGITLGERILQGSATFGKHSVQISYGANIAGFPAGGHLHITHLTDVAGKGSGVPGDYAAFGITASGKGQVAVMGDTNCLDSSHNMGACYDFLVALMQQLLQQKDAGLTPADKQLKEAFKAPGFTTPPQRRADVNLTRYSWVLQHPLTCYMSAPCQYRQPSDCPSGAEWQHKHLQPGGEPDQGTTRLPAAVGASPALLKAAEPAPAAPAPAAATPPAVQTQPAQAPGQTPAAQQQTQQEQQSQAKPETVQDEGEEQQQGEEEQQQQQQQQEDEGQQQEEKQKSSAAASSSDASSTAGQQTAESTHAGATVLAGQTAEQQALLTEHSEHPDKMDGASHQQQQQEADKAGTTLQRQQTNTAARQEQVQQGQRRAFIGQAMSLATFICLAGVVGVMVLWRMRAGSPRKWAPRRGWGYGPVRRSPSPEDV